MDASSQHHEDWQLLRRAIREPVRQMIAVEVDTAARTQEIISDLTAIDPVRPQAVIEFDLAGVKPEELLAQAVDASRTWSGDGGLLFVCDSGQARPSQAEAQALAFWQGMNLLREKWAALASQTVFVLLPLNYRYLTTTADHLKRWISLKIHLLGIESFPTGEQGRSQDAAVPGLDLLSPDVARQSLTRLEQELQTATQRGESPTGFARRYYLPMFAAALSLGELERAERLRDKARAAAIAAADLPQWLQLNAMLETERFRLEEAEKYTSRLVDWAKEHGGVGTEAVAYFWMGRIAEERRDFAAAEGWYLKSLAVSEKQGNEHGEASSYHQLGRIAQEQRDFAAAEGWYLKSLAIKEKQGNERGAASTYHQLGIIAGRQHDFAAAEGWYLKSLAIKEKQGNEHGAAGTHFQLGRLAEEDGKWLQAGTLFLKASAIFVRKNDQHSTGITLRGFARLLRAAPPADRECLQVMGCETLGDKFVCQIEQVDE